jgi:hypothetical protein
MHFDHAEEVNAVGPCVLRDAAGCNRMEAKA